VNHDKDLVKTIVVYNKLGVAYANRIANIRLPALYQFSAMLPKHAKVLDAGCAAGRDSTLLKEQGLQVVGVDLSTVLLDIARKEVIGPIFREQDIRTLNFPAESFDGVWANAVLLNLARSDVPDALH